MATRRPDTATNQRAEAAASSPGGLTVRLALTYTVIVDVPDDGRSPARIRDRFHDAETARIGEWQETRTGQQYVLREIVKLEVVPLWEVPQ